MGVLKDQRQTTSETFLLRYILPVVNSNLSPIRHCFTHINSGDCSSPPFYPLFRVITVMAALEFHGGHDNRVFQALAVPLASKASGRASADKRPDVLLSLTSGYKIWRSTGFDQSMFLLFVKAAVSNALKIRVLLANPTTNDYGQIMEHLSVKFAPITTRPWFCHHCGNSYSLATPRCVHCDHIRCGYCNVE